MARMFWYSCFWFLIKVSSCIIAFLFNRHPQAVLHWSQLWTGLRRLSGKIKWEACKAPHSIIGTTFEVQLLPTRCSKTTSKVPAAWKPGGTEPEFPVPLLPGCLELFASPSSLCYGLRVLSSLLITYSLPALGYCDRIYSPGNSSPKVAIETPSVGVWRKGCDSSQLMHGAGLHSLWQHRIRPLAFLNQFEPPQSVEEEDTLLLFCVSPTLREKSKASDVIRFYLGKSKGLACWAQPLQRQWHRASVASKHPGCQRLPTVKGDHSTLLNRIPTPLTYLSGCGLGNLQLQ